MEHLDDFEYGLNNYNEKDKNSNVVVKPYVANILGNLYNGPLVEIFSPYSNYKCLYEIFSSLEQLNRRPQYQDRDEEKLPEYRQIIAESQNQIAYDEKILEEDYNRYIRETESIFEEIRKYDKLKVELAVKLHYKDKCDFCDCHPNAERKAHYNRLEEELKIVTENKKKEVLKYFITVIKLFETIKKASINIMLFQRKRLRETWKAYTESSQSHYQFKKFVNANFLCTMFNQGRAYLKPFNTTRPYEPVSFDLKGNFYIGYHVMKFKLEDLDPLVNILNIHFVTHDNQKFYSSQLFKDAVSLISSNI